MDDASLAGDPRPPFRAALDQAQRQVEAIRPADFGRPTPCGEYDVRALLAHLVAVLRKLETIRHGGDATEVTDPADDLGDDGATTFHDARTRLEMSWASGPVLDATYTLPWGVMTGREVLDAYTHEFTVHSWDLAQSLGRGDELDPRLARAALAWFSRNVSEEERSEGGALGPVVTVPVDADPYDRLAGFVGRRVDTWTDEG